ncbi:glucose-repressible protein Grg1 [Mrakia frigida]|uniref:glucose-repressible protein Grg1 n=1 Tax=Mrakia frigida TaxID=29902 RepID=UPI003FCC177E
MDTIKNAANYVSETVQGTGAEASKEANKSVAKDSNASIGTRVSAGMDALGDKADQHGHEADATLSKEKAKH